MVVVVVLMGDRVRLGLVGGKTVPPPPPCGVPASRGLFSPPTEYQGKEAPGSREPPQGTRFVSHHVKRLEIFANLRSYIFARLRRITFKLDKFTNFKALFSAVSTDFP